MKKLEEMSLFFKNRVNGYDTHMLTEIEGASNFYPFTASLLPMTSNAEVLDLGVFAFQIVRDMGGVGDGTAADDSYLDFVRHVFSS